MKNFIYKTHFSLGMGVNMFRDRAIFLFVISAILIPLIFLTRELILIGMFIALFVLSQVILIYLFYKEKTTRLEQWYAFWTGILSLLFVLVVVVFGKRVGTEFLGLILFLVYFVGVVMFLFRSRLSTFFRKPKKKKPEEDFEEFRKKDEMKKLVDFFEPEAKDEVKVVDIEEPKIERTEVEEAEEPEKEPELEEIEEWMEELPKSVVFEEPETKPKEKPKIKELKEAPRVDFEKVKKDLEKIDTGVKTISDKLRVISEKAILEGAEKKVKALKKEAEKKKPRKIKKSEVKVYASKTGNRYHYDKDCLGLKRVSKKNLVTYPNSAEARKKKLKACEICK